VVEVVLDASALLAMLQGEPGAARVIEALPGARISAVNLAEVAGKLIGAGVPEATARAALQGLGLVVDVFDADQAWWAGAALPATRAAGLSLGDRACLALAATRRLPALTADRAWGEFRHGVDVVWVR
jgi:PIN domain nuclease of toxin-antitoxin system